MRSRPYECCVLHGSRLVFHLILLVYPSWFQLTSRIHSLHFWGSFGALARTATGWVLSQGDASCRPAGPAFGCQPDKGFSVASMTFLLMEPDAKHVLQRYASLLSEGSSLTSSNFFALHCTQKAIKRRCVHSRVFRLHGSRAEEGRVLC